MALINCPECEKEVSDTAKKCLHCGYRLTPPFDWVPLAVLAAASSVIAAGFLWVFAQKYTENVDRWERNKRIQEADVGFQDSMRKLKPNSLKYDTDYKESVQELKDLEDNKPGFFW